MTEVLVEYETALRAPDGTQWTAQAAGREADDGMWDGWIEFIPADGSREPLRSPSESRQSSREDLLYWATGLSPVYLEGAFGRAVGSAPVRQIRPAARPVFEGPAETTMPSNTGPVGPRPTFDPFAVHLQGEQILVDQLGALDVHRLRDIAIAYELVGADAIDGFTREQLADAIASAVVSRAQHETISERRPAR